MRGTSDRDVGQWPHRPADVGVNDVWIFNRETGKGIEREAKAGNYGSEERKAQNARLEARAAEINRKFELEAKASASLPHPTAPDGICVAPEAIPQGTTVTRAFHLEGYSHA